MIGDMIDCFVSKVVPVSKSMIVEFHAGEEPVLWHVRLGDLANDSVLNCFIKSTYKFSPYYVAFLNGSLNAFTKIADTQVNSGISVQGVSRSIFPHVSLIPEALADEVCFSFVKDGRALCYIAMRDHVEGAYSSNETSALEARTDIILQFLEHAASSCKRDDCSCLAEPARAHSAVRLRENYDQEPVDDVNSFLSGLFAESLSGRERSVIIMTLQGQSVEDIADALGISPHTVRVHMRNAYGKLRVRNRLELFGMFIKRVSSRIIEANSSLAAAE